MKYSGAWLLVENFWSILLVTLLIIVFIVWFDKYQKNHTAHDKSEQPNKDNWVARIDLISFRFGFIFLILIFAILFCG